MPKFRGNPAFIQTIRESCEFILSGPYETGKTFATLWLLDSLLREFPGSRAAILRKIRATMDSTVLETWRNVIAIRGGVEVYGGNRPVWYDYANGSRVYIGGLDDPGKSLSGERDFIYCNQTEELDKEDWETLSTRATGRSAKAFDFNGVPIAILFGDCNPGSPDHWILKRKCLNLLATTHKDNPTLYTDNGELTKRGKQSMKVLENLTGVQRLRGLEGKWVVAEGVVYEIWVGNPSDTSGNTNVTELAEYDPSLPVYWGCDDGYSGEVDENGDFTEKSHPRVILLYQVDATGKIKVFEENYQIKTLPEKQIQEVLDLGYPKPLQAVVDPSAADLKGRLYDQFYIDYVNAKNSVEEGIKCLRSWIAPDLNGVRRFLVHPRCAHFRREMLSYRYDKNKPKKVNDHGPDTARYIAMEHT